MTILISKFANHQIRHLATSKTGCECQPGNCRWSLLIEPLGFAGYACCKGPTVLFILLTIEKTHNILTLCTDPELLTSLNRDVLIGITIDVLIGTEIECSENGVLSVTVML